jgi:hypothetical protein
LRDLGEDVSSTAVSNWFAGSTQARPALVDKLAQILEADPAWLATGAGRGPQQERSSGKSADNVAKSPAVETVDIPVPIRPGVVVRLTGIPNDLTSSEARKLANVVLALASIGS